MLKIRRLFRARLVIFLIALALLLPIGSCKDNNNSSTSTTLKSGEAKTPELLLYCGITMIRPMTEIATIIEQQENCKITIIKGGSGDLLKSITASNKGDLFLPGSDNYFQQVKQQYPGLVTRIEQVGHNRAVIMVQKGNPLGLTNDLDQLKSHNYAVVIGNDKSGSIGKETRGILEKKGIYEDVVRNAMQLTTDSKDLVKVIREKQADIVINWYAVYTWDDNPQYMDVIEIDEEYCQTQGLAIGLLGFSEHDLIANKLIDLAKSEQGKAIFKKYGLYFN